MRCSPRSLGDATNPRHFSAAIFHYYLFSVPFVKGEQATQLTFPDENGRAGHLASFAFSRDAHPARCTLGRLTLNGPGPELQNFLRHTYPSVFFRMSSSPCYTQPTPSPRPRESKANVLARQGWNLSSSDELVAQWLLTSLLPIPC